MIARDVHILSIIIREISVLDFVYRDTVLSAMMQTIKVLCFLLIVVSQPTPPKNKKERKMAKDEK